MLLPSAWNASGFDPSFMYFILPRNIKGKRGAGEVKKTSWTTLKYFNPQSLISHHTGNPHHVRHAPRNGRPVGLFFPHERLPNAETTTCGKISSTSCSKWRETKARFFPTPADRPSTRPQEAVIQRGFTASLSGGRCPRSPESNEGEAQCTKRSMAYLTPLLSISVNKSQITQGHTPAQPDTTAPRSNSKYFCPLSLLLIFSALEIWWRCCAPQQGSAQNHIPPSSSPSKLRFLPAKRKTASLDER